MVNDRLALDNQSIDADRSAKAEIVDRLTIQLAAIDADREALRLVNEQIIEDMHNIKAELVTKNQKIYAKNEALKILSGNELKRKSILKGTLDFLSIPYMRRYLETPRGTLFSATHRGDGFHIGVDVLEIIFGVSGGVETYMKMLVEALIASNYQITIICLPDQLEHLQKAFKSKVNFFIINMSWSLRNFIYIKNILSRKKTRINHIDSLATFAFLKEDTGIDILHSPVQIFSKLDFNLPSVLNLHDLQHLHFPENFRPSDIAARNYLYGLSASLADAIIVSSDFVRNDLIMHMAVSPEKIITIPVTWDPAVEMGLEDFGVEEARKRYQLPLTYAIFPAQFWPHKNHARLVEALHLVRTKTTHVDFKLVFTGYRGHSGWPLVQKTIKKYGLEEPILCLDHVPVSHLAALYKASLFCIMPSTFEASSYPVIEAQILGCPVMCSNITSLPELMRDGAGILFDPFSPIDMSEKMILWINDEKDRYEHAKKALIKARVEHSLEKYIAGITAVYKNIKNKDC